MIFKIAFRNISRQARRFFIVALAIAFGFMLITIINSLIAGALLAVQEKAARYFAGQASITRFNSAQKQDFPEASGLIDKLETEFDPGLLYSPRTIYYRINSTLSHNGQTIRQRRLMGVDFETEAEVFSGLKFLNGGLPEKTDAGDIPEIIISRDAASLLAASTGDEIKLFLTTEYGQYNTSWLRVAGVFDETSLFGFVAYMDRAVLNGLMDMPPSWATDIAVFAGSASRPAALAASLHDYLSDNYFTLPMPKSRDENEKLVHSQKYDYAINIMSLDAYLSQIKDLLNAVLFVSWIIIIIFVFIVLVGIVNTYRVILFERTPEIGTMRAIGCKRTRALGIFLLEALLLCFFSCLAGFLLALVILGILGAFNFDSVSVAGLFTRSGHLFIKLDPSVILLCLGIMLLAVSMAALGPARKASKVEPALALRNEL